MHVVRAYRLKYDDYLSKKEHDYLFATSCIDEFLYFGLLIWTLVNIKLYLID